MNALFFLNFLLLFLQFSYGQEYKFGHLFKRSLTDTAKGKGTLFVIRNGTSTKIDTIGEINANELTLVNPANDSQTFRNNANILIRNQVNIETKTYTLKTINGKLKGVIKKRSKDGNHDSLFIRFWDITKEPPNLTANANIVNSTNKGQNFVFVIKPTYWTTTRNFFFFWNRKRKFLQIPYRTWQFTATNLPFRILTKSGDLESEFLNANLSFIKTFGHTNIYESEFVKPRNWSLSVGPYLGLTAIDNPSTNDNKKEFGLNYGLNGIYAFQNFNITAALGFQNGFNVQTKSVQPYIGFGIGFKLVEFFNPEIKEKDED